MVTVTVGPLPTIGVIGAPRSSEAQSGLMSPEVGDGGSRQTDQTNEGAGPPGLAHVVVSVEVAPGGISGGIGGDGDDPQVLDVILRIEVVTAAERGARQDEPERETH